MRRKLHQRLALLLALLLLSGCIPLKQYHVTGGQQYDAFSYMEHEGCGLLRIGPAQPHKTIEIVNDESYAIGPRGNRYGVESEPHPYDLREDRDPRLHYVRDRIYLTKESGKRLKSWKNGEWQFTFVMDGPEGRDTREFEMTLGTFHYNPVVHGPPN